jgi:prolyl-tRNA editing enzyme YbaK/EbsC (Cys-tRNA(Pro) deacylase)
MEPQNTAVYLLFSRGKQVEVLIGHAVGGVCPFGIHDLGALKQKALGQIHSSARAEHTDSQLFHRYPPD